MRYNEIVNRPYDHERARTIAERAAAKAGLKPALTEAHRATMPHIVDCDGLTREVLQGIGEFEKALNERREWCEEQCPGQYVIEPLGPNPEQLTGRRFRFADADDAVHFKLRWC